MFCGYNRKTSYFSAVYQVVIDFQCIDEISVIQNFRIASSDGKTKKVQNRQADMRTSSFLLTRYLLPLCPAALVKKDHSEFSDKMLRV